MHLLLLLISLQKASIRNKSDGLWVHPVIKPREGDSGVAGCSRGLFGFLLAVIPEAKKGGFSEANNEVLVSGSVRFTLIRGIYQSLPKCAFGMLCSIIVVDVLDND